MDQLINSKREDWMSGWFWADLKDKKNWANLKDKKDLGASREEQNQL